MHSRRVTWVAAGMVLALAWPAMAAAATVPALVNQGNGRGVPACRSCHGADGGGQPAAGFPRLAGLDAGYLRKQLSDYADGTRTHAVMQPIARALSADERGALATYYGRLAVPAVPAGAKPEADDPGAMLATRGRWSQRVPACEQCHGPGGAGVGEHFPPLAGQPAAYIEAQLKAWQQGSRRNDPLEPMRHLSRALSAQDIHAVAQWFAAQPLTAGGGGR
jgi:cytochrome c553